MKRRMTSCLVAGLVAFGLGLACADLFRALTPSPEEISLSDELTPQPDLYREAMLRGELSRLRGLLDQYAAGHAGGLRPSSYPRSLDDLVREGYLPELPVDPMTGERDWQPEGPACLSSGGAYYLAIFSVHSKSSAIASDGTRYSEW
jgi:general secretion pathway protein G